MLLKETPQTAAAYVSNAPDKKLNAHEHPLRESLDELLTIPAEQLYKYFGITPNEISVLGGTLVAMSAFLAVEAQKLPDDRKWRAALEAFLCSLGGTALDKLDGVMAKVYKKKKLPHDGCTGALIDTILDRFQEVALGYSRMQQAFDRGDQAGMLAALTSSISSQLPTFFRAVANMQFKEVPEQGNGVLESLGTRACRYILALSTFCPKLGPVPLQLLTDALSSAANINTAVARAKVVIRENPLDLTALSAEEQKKLLETKDKAELKVVWQTAFSLIGGLWLLSEYLKMTKQLAAEKKERTQLK
jgi:phosphatidylglycerophosphate synthase